MEVARGNGAFLGENILQDSRWGAAAASIGSSQEGPRDQVDLGARPATGNHVMPRTWMAPGATAAPGVSPTVQPGTAHAFLSSQAGLPAACAGASAGEVGSQPSASAPDAWAVLADYRPYRELASNRELEGQFQKYMEWLGSHGTADADYLKPHHNDHGIHFTSMMFHEKVEFQQWLALGHRASDVMDLGYFQSHYEQVYPVAHSRAMTEEMALLHEYAHRRGLPPAPSLAYVLMSPLAEDRNRPVAGIARRALFNPEIAGQAVTRADLEAACRLFEDGGFVYPDRAAHLEEALRCLEQRPH